MIPGGADAVIRVERTRREDEIVHIEDGVVPSGDGVVSSAGVVPSKTGVVHALACVPPGAEVRRAGEDVRAGATVLHAGTMVGPAEIGVLAALGHARVSCTPPPRVSVLVTGDELLSAGESMRPGAIRDSNSHALAALVRCAGGHVLRTERVHDDERDTREAVARAAPDSDLLVICGGVSVGAHDHVRPALRALGAERRFWGLALKPGHPTWFGTLGGTLVFALPGNPVSAMVTFGLLAAPALRALQGAANTGERASAALDEGYEKPAGRAHALRCRLSARPDGWHARVTGPQGSHVLSSMLADALAVVPSATTRVAPGEHVEIVALHRALTPGGWT
jgi:molybdopterin molybdotransferase